MQQGQPENDRINDKVITNSPTALFGRSIFYNKGEKMKKLLILPVVLGLAACDRYNVFELKCASGDIYNPYNDIILQVEEGRIHFTDKARKEWGMSFYMNANTNYSDKESGISVWLDNGYIDHAEVANGTCDVVVPMGTQFNADCQGTKLSGQINKDHAIVSIDGGDEVRLPLSAKNADETVNIDGYIFKESENGWALSVAADTGADKVFQIGISEPNGQSVYKGCQVHIPLNH